eukprot:PhM_4_TR14118/c0_g1_i1/m.43063/K10260/FBXW7, SEL10; F-box and WD-40 domain protein 7
MDSQQHMDPETGAMAVPMSARDVALSNLTATPNSKKLLQMENAKKVQRRKLEKMFMQGIGSNYNIEHLEELKQALENEEPKVAPTPRPAPQTVRSVPQKPTDTIRVVNEFSGSVRALELTQGGATLWTAEADGSIGVRSGMTGGVVHAIAKHGELMVESLYATDNHMWVGLDDGTVRVFDHLVYLCIHEAKFHTDAVTCFTVTFDGKVFSGSADTTIVKWDHERRSFELMTKILAGHTKAVRCLVSYGYHLFSGSEDPVIRCADTETGQKVQVYEGHTGAINALLVLDGFLFSASDDHSVRVWNIESGECLQVLTEPDATAPVTSLVADVVGHRLWSADVDGIINVWDSNVDVGFKHIQTLTDHQGTAIKGMRNFCAIDATKVWSLASNGINRVWYSSLNKVEDAMQETIHAMQDILNEDVVELDKWSELIHRMRSVDERRKQELSDAMQRSSETSFFRIFYLKWARWIHVKRVISRRKTVCELLSSSTETGLRQAYYWKLWGYFKLRRQQFLRMSMTKNLLATTEKGLVNIYWKRMKEFRDKMKAKEQRVKLLESLVQSTDRGLVHAYYRRWFRLLDETKKKNKRLQVCDGLLRGTDVTLRRVYYFKLLKNMRAAKDARRRLMCCEALSSFTERGSMQIAYHKWERFAKIRRRLAKKRVIADALARSLDSNCLASAYATWCAVVKERQRQRLEDQIEQGKEKLADLCAQYKQVEHLLERQKLLEEAQARIDAAELEKAKRLDRIAALKREHEDLRNQISEKEKGVEDVKKSISEQLNDIMAKLKAKVLNFHFDYALIAQMKGQHDKVKKLFLEAHIRVKRVVVDLTKLTNPPPVWPLTPDMIQKMPSHQIKVVLRAIKEMIIAFDMMDTKVRDSLESDEEIVSNAETLMLMADVCVQHIHKTLGKAATRVK